MRPILFAVGPFQIYAFGAMVALGVLVSLSLMPRLAARLGFPSKNDIYDLVIVTIAAGFAGGRLVYVLKYADYYATHPLEVFSVWQGGLIYYGGVAGALTGLYFWTRFKKLPFLKTLDFLFPFLALTQTFGRIGCFLTGCCYGKPCSLPWAVFFADQEEALHPTQLYEAAFTFGLFVFLRARLLRSHRDGQIAAEYLFLYALGRFIIEYFRGDNPYWFFWTSNQWMSLAIMLAAAFGWRYLRLRKTVS